MHRETFVVGAAMALFFAFSASATPLPEDAVGRRAIRGSSVETAHESAELLYLRRFDEESFPRAPLFIPPLSDPGDEAIAPSPAPPHPSAESPPEALRSPEAPAVLDAVEADHSAAIPWLSGLRLPDMPVRFEPRLIRYLEFYKSDRRGRAIMASWLKRQGRYRALIETALRRYKLPESLLYVCMIESGYDPLDRSSAGASGLWQFMPEGGRIYGLRIDRWVDERRDPEKATEAVVHYFADLHARFGSWHLALAAFNAGYGAVLRAVAKYNTNDYWELSRNEDGLPWETTLYVPKALAAAIVGKNREVFGYADLAIDPPLAFDRVVVPSSTSLAGIAKAAGVTVAELAALNPELKCGRTPPESWEARVPSGAGPRFATAWPKSRDKIRERVVRFGERIEELARAFGTSSRELRRLNGFEDSAELKGGLTILVPDGRPALPAPPEELVSIVAVPDKDLVVAGRKRLFYRALPGDDLDAIASFFHVSTGDLGRWNSLDGDARLSSKMVLQIWVAPEFDTATVALLDPARVRVVTCGSAEFFDLVEARNGRKRVDYTIRAGDTMKRIGARFSLSEGDLERINRMGRKSDLKAGKTLIVYVPMSPKERAAKERELLASMKPPETSEEASDADGEDDADDADDPAPPAIPAPASTDTKAKEGDPAKGDPAKKELAPTVAAAAPIATRAEGPADRGGDAEAKPTVAPETNDFKVPLPHLPVEVK